MLLRSTKKFFQKTIDSVKSFLSGGYQRLPKSPCNAALDLKYSQSYKDLDSLYTDFTNQWDNIDEEKASKSCTSNNIKDSSPTFSRYEDRARENLIKHAKATAANHYKAVTKGPEVRNRKLVYEGKRYEDLSVSKGVREERGLVTKKLKELETLDKTNIEHLMDIEEILHYYSRLTCPAYLDIVESFFMDMYSELFSGQPSSRGNSTWPQLQTVRF